MHTGEGGGECYNTYGNRGLEVWFGGPMAKHCGLDYEAQCSNPRCLILFLSGSGGVDGGVCHQMMRHCDCMTPLHSCSTSHTSTVTPPNKVPKPTPPATATGRSTSSVLSAKNPSLVAGITTFSNQDSAENLILTTSSKNSKTTSVTSNTNPHYYYNAEENLRKTVSGTLHPPK